MLPDFPVYYERRRAPAGDSAPPFTGPERRVGDLQQGWLCFDNGCERRRLYPIPAEWETCPDQVLDSLLGRAGASSRPRLADAE